MNPTIVIRPPARRDLDEQADYLGRRSRPAGRRFYDAAQKAFKQLAAMPQLGSLCEFANPKLAGLRVWPIQGFEKYLIYYLPVDQGIVVVRVLHGARDVERLLDEEHPYSP